MGRFVFQTIDREVLVSGRERAHLISLLNLQSGERSRWIKGLNNVLLIGNDPAKLAARLLGQCEIHTFVEGKNRTWLAVIIEDGLRQNIFTVEEGWENVVELLLFSDKGPVVTSWTTERSFPDMDLAIERGAWPPSATTNEVKLEEALKDLSFDEAWQISLETIRGMNIELKPDNWERVRFGSD